ncbi:MAG: tRNA glutamyl-Q(34) synthetase GluQRS [Burkholderiaceae bacterium]
MPTLSNYVGRFAPSPTGPLHAGSLVAALASWLDARAHGGRWLVRIEDVDIPRCLPGADRTILAQLDACGLRPDAPPVWQSARSDLYAAALATLTARGWTYPCACSRHDIEQVLALQGRTRPRHAELVYPGTCRHGLHGKPARTVRVRVAPATADPSAVVRMAWHDRRLGATQQDLTAKVGDFVLRRADGLWAYQLAVVVDDAAQGVSHIVRGADLADNTPRQLHLQRLLGLHAPSYLHTPLVLGADGGKLSKQNGALALDLSHPLAALRAAGNVLGLTAQGTDRTTWLLDATTQWGTRWIGPTAGRVRR